MRRKGIIAVAAGVLIILAVLSFFYTRKPIGPERIENLRLGFLADPLSSLLYIARERGMFKRHGLDVSFESYEGGAYAVRDLLAGQLDVAVATEFILVLQGLKRADLRGIGTISTANNIEVIARSDRGIEKPEDLKGKRAGVIKGTINEFLLNVFLSFNSIRPAEIQTVDLKPSETVTALSEGQIEAGCLHPPFSYAAKKKLASKAISWSAQGGQEYFFLMLAKDELIKARPRAITSLLEGLLEAETFLKEHHSQARDIVARALNLAPEAVTEGWSKIRFRVRLDQELLTLMEDEARWAIRNKLVDAEKIPNYFPLLYLEGLQNIKPEAVGVIH